jgi:hypothetical protein
MLKVVTLVSALLALGGCATCQNHPYVCAIGGAIIVGSVVATVEAHQGHDNRQPAPLDLAQRPYLK